MQKIILLIATILVSSCCGIPQKANLTLPPETICPQFRDMDLIGVNDITYAKVAELDIICKETIPTYRNIIKSTQ